jgi:hypothetical protein
MRDVGAVHGGEPILGLSFSKLLHEGNVLKENQHRFLAFKVHLLELYREGQLFVHSRYRDSVLIPQSFFHNAREIHYPLKLFILFLFVFLRRFVESHCVFFVAENGDLRHDLESERVVDGVSRLRNPVDVCELRILE